MWPFAGPYPGIGRQNWYDTYGSRQLTELSPQQSAIEPVTLQMAQDACGVIPVVGTPDLRQNRRLTGLAMAARIIAEKAQNRALAVAQWDLVFDYWPERKIRLVPPVISVDLVQYTDNFRNTTSLVQSTPGNVQQYSLDNKKVPPIIVPEWNNGWPTFTPCPSSAVLIRYTCGYGPNHGWWSVGIGAGVMEGMIKLIQHWNSNGISVQKALGQAEELPYTITALLETGAISYVG
jgi:hypothetical protein